MEGKRRGEKCRDGERRRGMEWRELRMWSVEERGTVVETGGEGHGNEETGFTGGEG